MNRFLTGSRLLMNRLRAVSARAVEEAQMDRSGLQRDWLYNNSHTAFVGALLILLARHIRTSDEGAARGVEPSSIQWAYSVQDWVAPHLSPLYLPLSGILCVIAFALLVASTWRKSPVWAAQVSILISFLSPIFVLVGLFTAWLPLVGNLFTSDPNVGVVVFYVGFVFVVLISVRPIVVMRLNGPNNTPVTRKNEKSNKTENGLRKRLRDLRTAIMYPYGMRRTINPFKWRPVERIIVLTQGIALITIIVSLVAKSASVWPSWMPVSPEVLALISASLTSLVLMGVLWHTVSAGDLPLTNRRAHYIRQVVDAMEFEKQGAEMDWENVGLDGGNPVQENATWLAGTSAPKPLEAGNNPSVWQNRELLEVVAGRPVVSEVAVRTDVAGENPQDRSPKTQSFGDGTQTLDKPNGAKPSTSTASI